MALTVSLALAPATALGAWRGPVLLSRASGPAGEKANAPAGDPSVSANGRFVAFDSTATNLDPADTTPRSDVYVRDRVAGTTTLVSRAGGPSGAVGDGASFRPSISADGRFVAFQSNSANLDPGVPVEGGELQVYVRDLLMNVTAVASRATGPAGAAAENGAAHASISADGRLVAFHSASSNLDPQGTSHEQVYVRDLTTQTTELMSRASGSEGAPANAASREPSISSDGTSMAFVSYATNLGRFDPQGQNLAFVRNIPTGTTTLVSRKSGANGRPQGAVAEVELSGDGSAVAFQSGGIDPREASVPNTDVYLRDLGSNKTTWISRGVPDANDRKAPIICSSDPALSADGRRVAFATAACPGSGDPKTRANSRPRVFVRDLDAKMLIRVPGAVGQRERIEHLEPSLSANGRWLAFRTRQSRLSREDRDSTPDVFAVRVRN